MPDNGMKYGIKYKIQNAYPSMCERYIMPEAYDKLAGWWEPLSGLIYWTAKNL